MSNTPRTDAAIQDFSYRAEYGQLIGLHLVDPEFAKVLERELRKLASDYANLREALVKIATGGHNEAKMIGFAAAALATVPVSPALGFDEDRYARAARILNGTPTPNIKPCNRLTRDGTDV